MTAAEGGGASTGSARGSMRGTAAGRGTLGRVMRGEDGATGDRLLVGGAEDRAAASNDAELIGGGDVGFRDMGVAMLVRAAAAADAAACFAFSSAARRSAACINSRTAASAIGPTFVGALYASSSPSGGGIVSTR